MANDRSQILKDKFEELGIEHVYTQPPESVKLEYPCVILRQTAGETSYANNMPYIYEDRFEATYIRRNRDPDVRRNIAMSFAKCRHDRSYSADNLYHSIFVIYI